jgi:RNA polymerase sigma factor for flagellar operon FliA
MRDGQEHVMDTWRRFKNTGDLTLRNELVLSYISLVRYVASKVATGLPNTVDRDDLISYGTFGLMDAIAKFDLEKNVKFETYAITRIKGSIIDALRDQDWVPRSVRSKARNYELVKSELETELGRTPHDAELAGRLGITIAELWMLQDEASVISVTALDEHQGDEDRPSVSELIFDVASNPEDLYGQNEVTDLLVDAIDELSDRSKTILVLYYVEEMTLAEIGDVLGVTESRVCQLQGKLLQSLRESLSNGRALAA